MEIDIHNVKTYCYVFFNYNYIYINIYMNIIIFTNLYLVENYFGLQYLINGSISYTVCNNNIYWGTTLINSTCKYIFYNLATTYIMVAAFI